MSERKFCRGFDRQTINSMFALLPISKINMFRKLSAIRHSTDLTQRKTKTVPSPLCSFLNLVVYLPVNFPENFHNPSCLFHLN